MKVVICAYNWIGCEAIRQLIQENHQLYVFTHKSPYYINSVEEYCSDLNIEFSLDKISKTNLPFTPDIIISIYYRFRIPDEVLKLTKGKNFNLHPSLLPDYKGCGSLTWAMINEEKFVGFTFHFMTSGFDEGNIILQKAVPLENFETQQSIYYRIMVEAGIYFKKALELVVNGYKGIPQEKRGDYYPRKTPHDGIIDVRWKKSKIKRFINAFIFPPLPVASYKNKEIKNYKDFESFGE